MISPVRTMLPTNLAQRPKAKSPQPAQIEKTSRPSKQLTQPSQHARVHRGLIGHPASPRTPLSKPKKPTYLPEQPSPGTNPKIGPDQLISR